MLREQMIDTTGIPQSISHEGIAERRLMADWERVRSNLSKAQGLSSNLLKYIDSFNTKIVQYSSDPSIRAYMQDCVNALSRLVDSNGNLIPVTEDGFRGLSGFTYESLGNERNPDAVAKHVLASVLTVLPVPQPVRF